MCLHQHIGYGSPRDNTRLTTDRPAFELLRYRLELDPFQFLLFIYLNYVSYFIPGRGAKYSDENVCPLAYLENRTDNFKFCAYFL